MNLKSVLPFYSLDPFIVSENSTYYLSTNWGSLRSDCTGTGGDGLVYARIVILACVLVLAFIPRVNILVKSGPSTDAT